MGMLTREKGLEKEELKIEKVDLGDGDFTFVCQMCGREKDRWEQSLMKPKISTKGKIVDYVQDLEDYRAKLAVNTVCDEKGVKIFELSDTPTLSQNMGARKLELIVNAAQKLNKISDEDRDEMIKNSEGVQTEDSTSDSVES